MVSKSSANGETLHAYLRFLDELKALAPAVIGKNQRFLIRIEAELQKPLLAVKVGSEIDRAVISAAGKRKMAWNGGHKDDGQGMRFRLGQAAVCFFRWAYNEGLCARNPYIKNTFRRPPLREAHFLTDDQVQELLRHAEDLPLRERLLIHLLLDTGLRISEACRLKISDIDMTERLIHVHQTKVGRPKNPPFTDGTLDLMREWIKSRSSVAAGAFLFDGYKGRPISDKQVRLRFRRISRDIGFRVNPHALRHTAGTAWVEHAGQIPAMQILGHVDTKITNHYTHLVGKKLRMIQQVVMDKKSWHGKMPPAFDSVRRN